MRGKNTIAAVILYFISTGVSFVTFNFITDQPEIITPPPPTRTTDGGLEIDPSEPRTEICPINGKKYTKTEKAAWDQRRPLAVMIENHLDSRPQSGLSKADVVYETIAEGGITRFMAVYYCDAIAKDVPLAPIRSARTYFLDWASEYGQYPLYVHVGGANVPGPTDALGQIEKYGWGGSKGNDLNQFSIGYPTFYRDYNRLGRDVATEHTMVTSTERLWKYAAKRGWTNLSPKGEDWIDFFTPWGFEDEAELETRGTIAQIAFDFWDGFKQYDALWEYDKTTNTYRRSTGGEPHLDHNTKEPLTSVNLVVQFATEKGPVNDHKHMLYGTIDKGNALIFKDGKVYEARWSKAKRTDRTQFTDLKGKEIKFNPGRVWIAVVAVGTKVSY